MSPRHKWGPADFMPDGHPIEFCDRCGTERTRDTSTRSLYLYRRGKATLPKGRTLDEKWSAFKAGVIPKCVEVDGD